MILITTSLHCEASPIIKLLGLTKDMHFSAFPLFRNEQFALIESGVGKVSCAIATCRALAHISNQKVLGAINFGICGSVGSHKIGSLHLINKITEHATQRCFFPDILFKHALAEASIETFDKPVSASQPQQLSEDSLVDMEACGFFQAATSFFSPNRIACLKLVSDIISPETLNKEKVLALVNESLPLVDRFIETFAWNCSAEKEIFSKLDLGILDDTVKALKLTARQKQILLSESHAFLVRNKSSLKCLEIFTQDIPANKDEAKQIFARLLQVLKE